MEGSPPITIFTGISGIDKAAFVKKLLKKSGMMEKVLVIDFEKELINESRNPPETTPDIAAYLDSPDPTLKFDIFETTFQRVAKLVGENMGKFEHVFLLIHLSYFKNSEFYPPFIPTLYNQMFTRLHESEIKIITLIDDVFSVWQKISKREEKGIYYNTKLSLREILVWRSLESLRAESLKKHSEYESEGSKRVSHYVLAIRHPHYTFHNLIFKKKFIKIYLSYPISESRKTCNGIKDVNRFRTKMHDMGKKYGLVIFDPVAIDELCIKFALDKLLQDTGSSKATSVTITEKDRWPICLPDLIDEHIPFPITLPSSEVEEVIKDIKNQIVSRDYTLVDSASYLAVYRPFYNKIQSQGIQKEIDRANDHMKRVLVYHPTKDTDGTVVAAHPFGSRTQTYNDEDEFFNGLQNLIHSRK